MQGDRGPVNVVRKGNPVRDNAVMMREGEKGVCQRSGRRSTAVGPRSA